MENYVCPVCGGTAFKKIALFSVPSRYDKKKYPLYKCLGCKLVRPRPLPYNEQTKYDIYDEEGLTKCYNPAVKKIDFDSLEYNDYFKNFGTYARSIKKLGIKGRHLDIGCGSGHLMKISASLGLSPEGVELNAGILRAMREAGFIVHDREIGDKYYADGQYSLVTMSHVMEHIDDLHTFVGNVRRLLAPGGRVMMSMPFIYGLMPNLLRTCWYGHGSGQHLNFFSKESMVILLEKHGFEIEDIVVESMDYSPLRFPDFARKMIDACCNILVRLGQGDNLFVVARKKL
jgi:2-polyprenyl-3-methyl-5-hydroxy-6-metoxy-1,4-benzoquinol methylase